MELTVELANQSCDYYLREVIKNPVDDPQERLSGVPNVYHRGVHLVLFNALLIESGPVVGTTFTRQFVDYESLASGKVFTDRINGEILEKVKQEIDNYDPQKNILWLFSVPIGSVESYIQLYTQLFITNRPK